MTVTLTPPLCKVRPPSLFRYDITVPVVALFTFTFQKINYLQMGRVHENTFNMTSHLYINSSLLKRSPRLRSTSPRVRKATFLWGSGSQPPFVHHTLHQVSGCIGDPLDGAQHFLLALGASERGPGSAFEIKETHTLMIAACELFPLMNRMGRGILTPSEKML